MRSPLLELQGREVEVRVIGDITYRGILVEMTDQAVCLRSESGWIEIPVEKVVSIHKSSGLS